MGLAASDLFLEFLVQASVIVEERGIRPGIAELLEDQTNLLVRERVPPVGCRAGSGSPAVIPSRRPGEPD
jgi:hypothetical protein